MNTKRILVALSGGVDSSVAALLLKQEGYTVEAAFMKNWDETLAPEYYRASETGCSTKADQEDARAVAEQLGVRFHIFNFTREYYANVIENFFHEYQVGRTPNPDVLCNKYIKFRLFLEKALQLGFDYIATGHYARLSSLVIPDLIRDPETNKKQKEFFFFSFLDSRLRGNDRKGHPAKNSFKLLKGLDPDKDQSYFLWTLNQEQLKHCLFPIGEYRKSEIRRLAKEQKLITAEKPDSQGICFVGEVDVKGLLASHLGKRKGDIITVEGKKIGEHEGHYLFTIGQRHGIQVGGGVPYYVVSKNAENNTVVVAQGEDHPALYTKALTATQVHWINGMPTFPLTCSARIRYRQPDQTCVVKHLQEGGHAVTVTFDQPQRAVTPGQSIVFYDGDVCLGGGVIQ